MKKGIFVMLMFFSLSQAVTIKDVHAKDVLGLLQKSLAKDNVAHKKSSRKIPTFLEALKGAMYAKDNDNVCEFKRLSSEYFLMHEMKGMSLEDNLHTVEQVYALLKMEKKAVDHTVFVDIKRLANDVYRHKFTVKEEKMDFLRNEYFSCLDLEED
jgi:hypothetical protein